MKKMFVVALSFLCCMLTATACMALPPTPNTLSNEPAELPQAEPQIDLQLVGNDLLFLEPSALSRIDADDFQASEMDGSYLFSANMFTSILDQTKDVRDAIYDGNLIAIFDPAGISQDFDEALALPIQIPVQKDSELDANYTTVGHLYGVDHNDAIMVADVAVPADTPAEDSYSYFLQCADDFAAQRAARAAGSDGYLGSARKYIKGTGNRGNLDVAYDISLQDNAGGEDYYLVHGYLEATPGSGYKVSSLYTTLGAYGDSSNVDIYKSGPNTTTGSTQYTVSIVPTQIGEWIIPLSYFTWTRDIPDCNISKRVEEYAVNWTVTFNKRSSETMTFEPGATVVAPTGEKFTVLCEYVMDVVSPSATAVDSTFFFICSPSGIRY